MNCDQGVSDQESWDDGREVDGLGRRVPRKLDRMGGSTRPGGGTYRVSDAQVSLRLREISLAELGL